MPEDTFQDIRERLFEAAWDAPAFPPAPDRAVARARRRAATTIAGAALAVVLAIVVAAAALPFGQKDPNVGVAPEGDDREYLVDVRTGETTEITSIDTFHRAWWFDVSPDGRRIAYTSDRGGSLQVYVADLDGSNVRQLTHRFVDVYEPRWSPDGDRMAFGALAPGAQARGLYLLDLGTGRIRRITREQEDPYAPEWSPDGHLIAYSVAVQGPPIEGAGSTVPGVNGYELRAVDLRTGEVKKIFGGMETAGSDPLWIADGIVFVRGRGNSLAGFDHVDLAILRNGKHHAASLVGGLDHWAWDPELSPDGRTIAYARNFEGHEHVFLFDLETRRDRPLRPGGQATWVDADTLLVQDQVLDWNPEADESA